MGIPMEVPMGIPIRIAPLPHMLNNPNPRNYNTDDSRLHHYVRRHLNLLYATICKAPENQNTNQKGQHCHICFAGPMGLIVPLVPLLPLVPLYT